MSRVFQPGSRSSNSESAESGFFGSYTTAILLLLPLGTSSGDTERRCFFTVLVLVVNDQLRPGTRPAEPRHRGRKITQYDWLEEPCHKYHHQDPRDGQVESQPRPAVALTL